MYILNFLVCKQYIRHSVGICSLINFKIACFDLLWLIGNGSSGALHDHLFVLHVYVNGIKHVSILFANIIRGKQNEIRITFNLGKKDYILHLLLITSLHNLIITVIEHNEVPSIKIIKI